MEEDSRQELSDLSPYELKRLNKIKENQALVSTIHPLNSVKPVLPEVSSIVSRGHETEVTNREKI